MKDTPRGLSRSTIVKRAVYFLNAIMTREKSAPFDSILEKTRSGSFTDYEEGEITRALNETLLPLFRWSVTGFLLLLILARWCRDYTGPVVILLTIYLMGGLLVFWRDRDRKAAELERQIQDDTIIISSRREDGWGILITYIAVIIGTFYYMASTGMVESSARFWYTGDQQYRIDFVAFHLSLFASISAMFLSVFKYIRTTSTVITTQGIYAENLTLAWADLVSAKIEMPRFKRPALVVETKEGDRIAINITRLGIDRKKAIELETLFDTLLRT